MKLVFLSSFCLLLFVCHSATVSAQLISSNRPHLNGGKITFNQPQTHFWKPIADAGKFLWIKFIT